jgi:hypothetical protein
MTVMPTTTGSGSSTNPSTIGATTEALRQALRGSGKPSLGFVFAGPKHDLGVALRVARSQIPGVDFLGCSTAGEITERELTHGGLAVMLIRFDDTRHEVAYADELKTGHEQAAAALSKPFKAGWEALVARGFSASTTVMLIDGLSGIGEELVSTVRSSTSPVQQIVGGAAGDEGAFKATWVGLNDRVGKNSAAAVHVFGQRGWGVGVNHGLKPATAPMKVTRSKGAIVYELDGRPAFEAYKAFAADRGVTLSSANTGAFMIQHEIGIRFLSTVKRARAPLSVDSKGAITCAAPVPEGSFVSILDGEKADLVAAARQAAEEARSKLEGHPPAGVLLFDCICRGMILDSEFRNELDAVSSVFRGVPLAGFLTYGEIARFAGVFDGWHNTTAVVVAIPA